ncbi:MAG: type II secretion system protein [Minisyncoccia bacterium]
MVNRKQKSFTNLKISINSFKGFTLIELIVVTGIFLLITSIVLFQSNSFDSTITASNLAQDIALTVRKANAYTLGFQTPQTTSSVEIKGYGVNFVSGLGDSFVLFGETDPYDNFYTHSLGCGVFSHSEECIEETTIKTKDRITAISVDVSGSPVSLLPGDSLSIVFIKPTGEVSFCVQSGGIGSCNYTLSTVAHITVTSEKGKNYTVNIWNNGQINVQ